mmetsp:Transcript_54917/g.134367  ORF Transcript_54917/g.134367 Transcript_54917/m.134367 type:complete len:307 (-) Transcript_54917:284-1204(-)
MKRVVGPELESGGPAKGRRWLAYGVERTDGVYRGIRDRGRLVTHGSGPEEALFVRAAGDELLMALSALVGLQFLELEISSPQRLGQDRVNLTNAHNAFERLGPCKPGAAQGVQTGRDGIEKLLADQSLPPKRQPLHTGSLVHDLSVIVIALGYLVPNCLSLPDVHTSTHPDAPESLNDVVSITNSLLFVGRISMEHVEPHERRSRQICVHPLELGGLSFAFHILGLFECLRRNNPTVVHFQQLLRPVRVHQPRLDAIAYVDSRLCILASNHEAVPNRLHFVSLVLGYDSSDDRVVLLGRVLHLNRY